MYQSNPPGGNTHPGREEARIPNCANLFQLLNSSKPPASSSKPLLGYFNHFNHHFYMGSNSNPHAKNYPPTAAIPITQQKKIKQIPRAEPIEIKTKWMEFWTLEFLAEKKQQFLGWDLILGGGFKHYARFARVIRSAKWFQTFLHIFYFHPIPG